MTKTALIVYGGWDGHEPKQVAEIFEKALKADGFNVQMADTLDALKTVDSIGDLRLIVPVWTMGKLTKEQGEGSP